MKKNIIYTSLLSIALLLGACSQVDKQTPVESTPDGESRVLSVHLTPGAETRSIVKDLNSKNVDFRWEVGNFDLNIVFKQGSILKLVKGVEIKQAKGDQCSFDVEIPEGIDTEAPFDLYGAVAEEVKVKDGKILVGVGAHSLYELTNYSPNRDGAVPVWFKSLGVSLKETQVDATFEHLGAMAVVTIKNTSDKPFKTAGFAVRPTTGAGEFYLKGALPFAGNTELPYLNLLDQTQTENILTRVVYPSIDIAAGDVAYVGFWFRPSATTTPEINLVAYDATSRQAIVSTNTRPARNGAMQTGRAYNLYAQWDGTSLTLQDQMIEKDLPKDQAKIVFKTNQVMGGNIGLIIGAVNPAAERDVWIDLNNNGTRELGEYVTEFTNEMSEKAVRSYKINSETITIYGDVKDFCFFGDTGSEMTALDITANPMLDQLFVYDSKIGSLDLSTGTKLRRVGFENCGLTSFTMPTSAPGMQELYLTGNQLTTLDLTSAPNILGFAIANNQLTSVKYPKFTTLWLGEIQNNKLDVAAVNAFLSSLQKAEQKFAEWMYTATIYGNPGAATADVASAVFKGWTVINTDPDATPAEASTFNARRYMSTPLSSMRK